MNLKEVIANHPEVLEAAVGYWSGHLDGSKDTKFDNGATDQGNQMAMMMAMLNKKQAGSLSTEKVNCFKEALGAEILEGAGERNYFSLGTDYDPDYVLSKALDAIEYEGAGKTTFPWKTHMSLDVRDGKVEVSVSEGYRAPTEVLLSKEI